MLFRWLGVGTQGAIALMLVLAANKNDPWRFVPRNITAIALGAGAICMLRDMNAKYEDIERQEDTLRVLKDTQVEEQLTYLQSAAESRRLNEEADKKVERQLGLLERTAPILTEVLQLTGKLGPVVQMAVGMTQNGASIGDALTAVADAQMQLEQAKIASQTRQLELQQQQQIIAGQSAAMQPQVVQTITASETEIDKTTQLQKAAAAVGLKTECLRIDKAPSYQRLVFGIRTVDHALLPKWKSAAKLALGENDFPLYVHGSEEVAIELALKPEERTFYDFPKRDWKQGDRLIVLGQSLDGEVTINLKSEDTPQILIVGTTGSGKTNALRAIAYCLLMQGARVDICGGKVSDYQDFAAQFPSISVNDMAKALEYVGEYYQECDRRNRMTKEELRSQPAWVLEIDEYKGTVPLDEKLRKIYDQQLCEVARRGRGLKIHAVIGLQRGSKRTKDDPQALPPDLRDNLPCRIAFRCVDATSGRMVLHRRGEVVTALQGWGDGVIQSGILDTRFQAYRFDSIPTL
nr:FtsK/SpoIIIE domain-containing protein [Nostoc sp. EkiNYC01]